MEEGAVDFVGQDGDGFGFGVVCEGVEEGLREDGACGVLRVAGGAGNVSMVCWWREIEQRRRT